MERLQDKNRPYRRWRHSPSENVYLANRGLQQVESSNVSSIGRVDNDLIIRFHNGSLYKYPGNGSLYEDMLNSNSKGKFVWDRLRGRIRNQHKVPYEKIGVMPLPDDIGVTDEEIFDELDRRYVSDMTQNITVEITQAIVFSQALGINMQRIDIGGVVIYRPLT